MYALLAIFVSTLPVAAGSVSTEYTAGDKVVVIVDGAQLKVGQETVDKAAQGDVYTIREVRGEWLSVLRHRPGWIEKRQVMPLDSAAVDFFTRQIRNNPNE